MNKLYLNILVFVSGGSVLAIEILGTRILGPFYGVSIFLWSALISITLIALSIGYMIGGRWADKSLKQTNLYYLTAVAGIWMLLIPWCKYPVLAFTEPFGLRFAVLFAAFFLFAPPLTLLGMISPYAIRVRVANLQVVGRTAGDIYAVSTIGSVVSALLTGFVLIPNFGVIRLTLAIGILLLLCSLLGFALEIKSKSKQFAVNLIIIFAAMGVAISQNEQADPLRGLVEIKQSSYAEIRVVDKNQRRYLLIDGGTHTIVDPKTWQSFFPYTAVVNLSREFFKQPGSMLLVGLGGGTLVKNFFRAGWTVDAVEIDPVVIDVARRHFGLQESEGSVYCLDGRQFLISQKKSYDVIVMDAFGSSSIPFHLISKESFGLVASHLKPDGIFAINLESRGWDAMIVRSITATLKTHFSNVMVLPAYDQNDGLGNVVIFSANRNLSLQRELPQWEIPSREYLLSQDYRRDYRRDYAWDNRFEPDIQNAPILTDDLNPVDLWAEAINLAARKGLHDHFKERGVSW